MGIKFDIQQKDLYRMFIVENMRRVDIAEHYGCSEVLIKKKCQQYGIQKPKELEWKTKERKVENTCEHCGEIFLTTPSRSKVAKYCSFPCSAQERFLGLAHKRKVLNAVAARRRANMRGAIVELTSEEKKKVDDMYLNCPKGYEVDHIIPISKGGKHHPDNLQYLTIEENRRKANKILTSKKK
tara:strand:- start:43 stop:591 length:549 start_codon:yes stop_codon:yes gene_type:complete